MKTYRQFTALVDAIESALVTKFNVLPAKAEQWVSDYITSMPEVEPRPPIQIAHEIYMEHA